MTIMAFNTKLMQKPSYSYQRLFSSIRNLLKDWMMARSCIRQHWNNYRQFPSQRHIPYRVWLRHGAYLELDSQKD